MDEKCRLNSNRKPMSSHRLVTSNFVHFATLQSKLILVHISGVKTGNIQWKVRDRRETLKNQQKTYVILSCRTYNDISPKNVISLRIIDIFNGNIALLLQSKNLKYYYWRKNFFFKFQLARHLETANVKKLLFIAGFFNHMTIYQSCNGCPVLCAYYLWSLKCILALVYS